jgi:hypothetical protein
MYGSGLITALGAYSPILCHRELLNELKGKIWESAHTLLGIVAARYKKRERDERVNCNCMLSQPTCKTQ